MSELVAVVGASRDAVGSDGRWRPADDDDVDTRGDERRSRRSRSRDDDDDDRRRRRHHHHHHHHGADAERRHARDATARGSREEGEEDGDADANAGAHGAPTRDRSQQGASRGAHRLRRSRSRSRSRSPGYRRDRDRRRHGRSPTPPHERGEGRVEAGGHSRRRAGDDELRGQRDELWDAGDQPRANDHGTRAVAPRWRDDGSGGGTSAHGTASRGGGAPTGNGRGADADADGRSSEALKPQPRPRLLPAGLRAAVGSAATAIEAERSRGRDAAAAGAGTFSAVSAAPSLRASSSDVAAAVAATAAADAAAADAATSRRRRRLGVNGDDGDGSDDDGGSRDAFGVPQRRNTAATGTAAAAAADVVEPDSPPPPPPPAAASTTPASLAAQRYNALLHGCRSVNAYRPLRKIDEGTYGVVFAAEDIETGERVALKKVKMGKVATNEGFPITALRETNVLLMLRHPNIVGVREMVVGNTLDKVYMVMDYLDHDVKTLMRTMRQTFTQAEAKCLMQQLLRGVAFMHANWVIHRDLKTSNLLMNNEGRLVICDFGMARLYGDPLRAYTQPVVTLWYRAPELLLGARKYGPAVDVFSVGCIFSELLTKAPLFCARSGTELEMLNLIFSVLGTPTEDSWPGFFELPGARDLRLKPRPPLPLRQALGLGGMGFGSATAISDSGLDLLRSMIALDPARRISAADALNHRWFHESPPPADERLMPSFPSAVDVDAAREGGRTPDACKVPAHGEG